ncbi:hypothetical protein NS337_08365 [Pseudomonas oryzihabitans]|nr:hypothetical protein NS337_08365 [Pseudomonas psychrotolerans]
MNLSTMLCIAIQWKTQSGFPRYRFSLLVLDSWSFEPKDYVAGMCFLLLMCRPTFLTPSR